VGKWFEAPLHEMGSASASMVVVHLPVQTSLGVDGLLQIALPPTAASPRGGLGGSLSVWIDRSGEIHPVPRLLKRATPSEAVRSFLLDLPP
jgi:hypothetical protein